MQLTMKELCYPQPPTLLHWNNTTAAIIAANIVNNLQSWSIEMIYFWMVNQVKQRLFCVQWHQATKILADYYTKAHPASHYIKMYGVIPYTGVSPHYLQWAHSPSVWQGCNENIPLSYWLSTWLQVQIVQTTFILCFWELIWAIISQVLHFPPVITE